MSNKDWIMAKFFFSENLLGFELNTETMLEFLSFTGLVALIISTVYNRIFKLYSEMVNENINQSNVTTVFLTLALFKGCGVLE